MPLFERQSRILMALVVSSGNHVEEASYDE